MFAKTKIHFRRPNYGIAFGWPKDTTQPRYMQ